MARFRMTARAESDLEDIWDYVSANNVRAADRLVQHLMTEAERLAAQPGMGRLRDEFAKPVRSWPVGNYVIYYRVIDDVVNVVRIVHGARSLDELFGVDEML